MVRSVSVDSNGIKKGAWSEEEDNKLRAYIQRYGHWSWRLLPKYAGLKRCGKSCRLRWMNYLKPGVKRGNFSKQEEELVIECHAEMGNKWSAIAAKLPGRTDNEVKNFWHTRIQKRYKSLNPAEKKKGRSTSAMSSSSSETTPLTATTLSDLASSSAIGDNSPDQLMVELQVFDFWKDPFVADTTDYTTNDYFREVHDEWSGNSNSSYLSALHSWIPDYDTISNDHSLDGDIF